MSRQKHPSDIFEEMLAYLWDGLGLEGRGWKRLKKGDFKKRMRDGPTYNIWFQRSHYNYIDHEIGHGNVEVGFSCVIVQGDDALYSFMIEPTTGGSFFRMLTEDLQLDTEKLDTFLPLIRAHYLDFIDRFEADPVEALQPVCAPFTEAEDYSWSIGVRERMVELYGTAEQLEEYRRQAELRGTPECRAKTRGIARNAGVQGEDPYRKAAVLPVPCRGCGSCLGGEPYPGGAGRHSGETGPCQEAERRLG